MNRKWYVLVITACVIIGSCSAAAAEENEKLTPSKLFLAAYDSMTMGDWLTEQNMTDDARGLYNEALDSFREIARKYPLWQTKLVKFRIKHCSEQLKKLIAATHTEPVHVDKVKEKSDTGRPACPTSGGAGRQIKHSEEKTYKSLIHTAARMERSDELKNALDVYTAILAEQPGHLEALKGAMRCYLRMGSVDKAGELFQQEIILPANDADLHVLMAIVQCYYQQYDRAIQLLRLSFEEKPVNANAHIIYGIALLRTGRLNAAREEMKRALSLNSRLSEAYYNLTWISLKANPANIPVACAHYRNCLKYGGQPDSVLDNLLR